MGDLARSLMLYRFGHRALQTVIDKRCNFLRRRDFHLTINFIENPILTGFELFSLQVDMFRCRWIYSLSQRPQSHAVCGRLKLYCLCFKSSYLQYCHDKLNIYYIVMVINISINDSVKNYVTMFSSKITSILLMF